MIKTLRNIHGSSLVFCPLLINIPIVPVNLWINRNFRRQLLDIPVQSSCYRLQSRSAREFQFYREFKNCTRRCNTLLFNFFPDGANSIEICSSINPLIKLRWLCKIMPVTLSEYIFFVVLFTTWGCWQNSLRWASLCFITVRSVWREPSLVVDIGQKSIWMCSIVQSILHHILLHTVRK